jgi:plastocyanin
MSVHMRFKSVLRPAGLLLIVALALAACQPSATPAAPTAAPPTIAPPTTAPPTTAALTPQVKVSDQAIKDDSVTVASVVSAGPGWMVIHADANGKPGPVIGYTAVKDGENEDVVVKIDTSKATDTLYAMLHVDAGTVGTYEFPGADVPAMVDGQMVSPAFKVTKSGAATMTINISNNGFDTKKLEIKTGTTVKWVSTSDENHTVTADDGAFDSGVLSKGQEFQYTFNTAGTFPFYCKFHGGPGGQGMSGVVVVSSS